MVRFSDVIRRGSKKRPAPLEEKPPEDNGIKTREILQASRAEVPFEERAPEVPLEDTVTEAEDVSSEPWELKTLYDELLDKARDIQKRVQAGQGFSPSPALAVLHRIIQNDRIDEMFDYAVSVSRDEDLPRHSIAVALGSLKVGKGLGYNTEELLKLGLAAFLENVGMYRLPKEILEKQGKLSSDELAKVREHPKLSARILEDLGSKFQWLADTAIQTHERRDGSGYPQGLRGTEISELAAVIGLMDTYMAMIRKRPYRHEYVQTDAVKSIIQLGKGKFPQRVVKEFLNQVTLFPINTYVKLNNDSIGRVVATDESRPLRPTVELLYDGVGNRLQERKTVDLSASPLLHIVDTIDERDLP